MCFSFISAFKLKVTVSLKGSLFKPNHEAFCFAQSGFLQYVHYVVLYFICFEFTACVLEACRADQHPLDAELMFPPSLL